MRTSIRFAILAAAALPLASFSASAQTTYYVNGACGDDAWSGLSAVCQAPNGPKRTINAAWNLTTDYDTVVIAPGTYTGAGNTNIRIDEYDVFGRVLRSSDGPFETIIDGQGQIKSAISSSFADGLPDPTLVQGLTFTNFTGSAYFCTEAWAVIDRCRFINNAGYAGGAIRGDNHCQFTITNCEFIGNSATEDGGALSLWAATSWIANCTFVGNTAGGDGQSIWAFWTAMVNCIVRGPGQVYPLDQYSLTYSNVESAFTGEGNFDADPLFIDPGAGDYRLSPGSPCIDTGDSWGPAYRRTLDLVGAPRWFDDTASPNAGRGTPPPIDIGAHESRGPACPADCDGSGALDLFDFLCFTNTFNAESGACDPEFLPMGKGVLSGNVSDMAAFDEDGAGPGGPALFIAGELRYVDGVPDTRYIARWDGQSWSSVGGGVGDYGNGVYALAVFDDGSGPALYAGGFFNEIGGVQAFCIARWTGEQWESLGGGLGSEVVALTVFDEDGDGPAAPSLFAAGSFFDWYPPEDRYIARWNGQQWASVGDGIPDAAVAMAVFDADGPGPKQPLLHVVTDPLAPVVRTWDGAQWAALPGQFDDRVWMLVATSSGPDGPALYAGGDFSKIGAVSAARIARWDGQAWHPLGSGMQDDAHYDATVGSALLLGQEGPDGPGLYVGGHFISAGGVECRGVGRWDGQTWSPVGVGVSSSSLYGSVGAMAAFDPDADGPAPSTLHIGGGFEAAGARAENVAAWGCRDPQPSFADCNADGVLDLFDFLCFVNAFNHGC